MNSTWCRPCSISTVVSRLRSPPLQPAAIVSFARLNTEQLHHCVHPAGPIQQLACHLGERAVREVVEWRARLQRVYARRDIAACGCAAACSVSVAALVGGVAAGGGVYRRDGCSAVQVIGNSEATVCMSAAR